MCFRMTYSHRYQLPVSRYTWLFKVDVLQNEIFPYLSAATSITLRWMCCRMKYSQRYQLALLLPVSSYACLFKVDVVKNEIFLQVLVMLLPVSSYVHLFEADVLQNEIFPQVRWCCYCLQLHLCFLRWMCFRVKCPYSC